jgi:hypothetical protein
MKKLISIIALCLIFYSAVDARMNMVQVAGGVPVAGVTCTNITSPGGSGTDYDDFNASKANADYNSAQKVSFSQTGCKVATITMELAKGGSDVEVHLELWTTADKAAGSQIGGDSASVTVNNGSYGAFFSFDFASKPEPTGDYFIHVVKTIDATQVLLIKRAEWYGGTNYDIWVGPTGTVTDQNTDAGFSVTYE